MPSVMPTMNPATDRERRDEAVLRRARAHRREEGCDAVGADQRDPVTGSEVDPEPGRTRSAVPASIQRAVPAPPLSKEGPLHGVHASTARRCSRAS